MCLLPFSAIIPDILARTVTRKMALQLLPRSLPPWSYTLYVHCLAFGFLFRRLLDTVKLANEDSCCRHFSSSVPSKPTSISEPAGAAPYRWIEKTKRIIDATKSADEIRWFLFLFFQIWASGRCGSNSAEASSLPSGCGTLQGQYKYILLWACDAIPAVLIPMDGSVAGLRRMNECYSGSFYVAFLCYLCCVVFWIQLQGCLEVLLFPFCS